MISPKAIKFARAMALVSQTLPIPAAFAAGVAVAACGEDKPPEHPVGIIGTPYREPMPEAGVEPAVGTVMTATPPEKPPEPKVGMDVAVPEPTVGTTARPIEPKVGKVAPPEHEVGKKIAPERPPGKRAAPDAGVKF